MALDQDVVNLSKAIRQIESGNRAVLPQEKGIGGASRYQYTTSTWKSVAGKYLGDSNAPLTLENENEATYKRIKEWKDKGFTPDQIASMWNAGEGRPNAHKENMVGVNKYGVKYDVPAYVNKVYAEYQKQKELNPPTKKIAQEQPTTPEPEKEGLFSRAKDFIKKDVLGGGVKEETNLPGEIFRSTVGSRGLAGVAQMPGQVVGQLGVLKEQQQLNESLGGLAEQTTKLIKSLPTIEDPQRKERLRKLVQENLQTLQQGGIDVSNLQQQVLTPRQTISTSANATLTGLTGSGKGVQAAGQGLLGRTSVGTLQQAPRLLPTAQKVLTAGKGIIPRAVEQAGIGAGFVASENVRRGEPLAQNVGTGALVGAAIPFAGAGVSKVKSALPVVETKMAQRVVDSLIKPLMKDVSYGKNPGARVASEGIVFNSLEQGAEKISQRLDEIGQQMGNVIKAPQYQNKTYNFSDVLKSIDDEIVKLEKTPRTNASVINRLQDAKDDLLGIVDGVPTRNTKNMSLEDAVQFKRDIASLAKYTGAASDDKAYNVAIQKSAKNAKEKINKIAPEMKELNERWADLKSAETAIKYRDKIESRQNIIKFPTKLLGGGSIVAGTATLNPAVIAAGIATVGIEKLMSSSAFKTRLARWLAKSAPEERVLLLRDAPIIKPILDRIFGKNKELNESQIKELLNQWNSKAGLTIEDVSQKSDFKTPVVGKTALPIKKSIKKPELIDPDIFKKQANDYNPLNHSKYSTLAKAEYTKALNENKNPVVKLLAGGSGSGKTELVMKRIANDFDGIIYDGTLSKISSASKKIEQALAAGKKVEIHSILPRIESAWKFAQKRGQKTGRNVPLADFIGKHIGFVDTLKQVIDKYPKVSVTLKDTRNIFTKAEALKSKVITDKKEILDILNSINYNKENLLKELKNVKFSGLQ